MRLWLRINERHMSTGSKSLIIVTKENKKQFTSEDST